MSDGAGPPGRSAGEATPRDRADSRFWIETDRDDPNAMRWAETLLNPRGATSRLHFTRAWTALFFARCLAFFGPVALGLMLAAADPGGGEERGGGGDSVFLVTVIVTALLSFVVHLRRLSDVGRPPLWAGLVLVPILIGSIGFAAGTAIGARDYVIATEIERLDREDVNRRQLAIDYRRPMAYSILSRDVMLTLVEEQVRLGRTGAEGVERAAISGGQAGEVDRILGQFGMSLSADQRARLDNALDKRARSVTSSFRVFDDFLSDTDRRSLRRTRRGIESRWKTILPEIEVFDISQRQHGFAVGRQTFTLVWALPSFFVMLWSLFWLGRLPTGGGTISERMQAVSAIAAKTKD
ncbi:MAG: DUF805 domain-containing protein [Pseudomonadota bacterium]